MIRLPRLFRFEFDLRPRSIALRLALVYLAICLCMWAGQRHLMYVPYRNIESADYYGLRGYNDLMLETADHVKINAWYHPPLPGYPVLIYLHGNAGHMGHRAHTYAQITNHGFGLLALDYRGYGKSEGSPSEEGLYNDARAAIAYVTQTVGIPSKQLILYGESIGTAVAVQMATEFDTAALVLQSPFTSMYDMGVMRYPFLPVDLLLKDRLDSISKIGAVHVPLLLFHGDADQVVPIEQGRKLFEKANPPKQSIYYPGAGHVNLDTRKLTQALVDFCRRYGLIREGVR